MAEFTRKAYNIMLTSEQQGEYKAINLLWETGEGFEGNKYIDRVHYSPEFNNHIAGKIAQHLK